MKSTILALLVAVCATLIECKPRLTLDHDILASDSSMAFGVVVETRCHPEKPKLAIALVSWTSPKAQLSEQRLDITVVKSGFSERAYATLWPLRAGAAPLVSEKLQTNVATRFQRAFEINVSSLEVNKDTREQTLTIENLEPGLTYFARILSPGRSGWYPTAPFRIETPVCVADSNE